METSDPCMVVIFGASGDLTLRKLLPALFNLRRRGRLPECFTVLGTGRTPLDDASFRARMVAGLDGAADEVDATARAAFARELFYQPVDTAKPADFAALAQRMAALDAERGTRGNALFYLATPPSLFQPIAAQLHAQGLHAETDGTWRRVIVEKPFGYDLRGALELHAALRSVFTERQIYRIDHYLGKETVQNMMVLRFGNGIFEPLWNRNYVERVEITAAESHGVGDRGRSYDHSGALRDMFQNHLLQVAAMLAMEPPARFDADAVRNETAKVFEALRPIAPDAVAAHAVRGQYTASTVRGERLPGYREEADVPPDSRTETYAAVRFFVDNWRWNGVPFCVRTGKRLPTRVTEAVIHFKQAPHHLFGDLATHRVAPNSLILRVQPDEGILVSCNLKLPGAGFQMKPVSLEFHYSDLADVYVPEAYERLLLDGLLGDATLYARDDAVEACWRFVDPILHAWQSDPDARIHGYPCGTWGPPDAVRLLGAPDADWRYPCKNLAADGEYCEL